ncbi:MAG: hypothetical protein WBZ01_17580 [Terriglobales bacterium]|jgi:hypothetical protein
MEHEEHHIDSTFNLTDVDSVCILDDVARFKDIVTGLNRQTSRKCEAIRSATDEMGELLEPYQRYRELSEWIKPEQESARIGLALLLNLPMKIDPKADAINPVELGDFDKPKMLLAVNEADLDLNKYSLWRIIREIVRQTTEIRVYELEAHLKAFGIKTNRTAIESALATHAREFRITKRGREKYVSLKGA